MKHAILLLSFLLLASYSQGQSIADIPVQKIDSEYAEIIAQRNNSVGRYVIFISIGQDDPMRDRKGTPVKDASGNLIEINTTVKALNLMDELGYEVIQTYVHEADNLEHFILKKRS